uniref:RNA-dependent RNA polymerase n=1 Tax=Kalanchoe fedtschenkoi TaxID=63787 RepID=A0A7N0UYH8_KALFE
MPRKTSSSESPTVSPSLCHSSQLTTTSSSSPKGRGDSSSYTTSLKQVNPQLQALGELDFKRAFLVLCYIGRNQLEDVAYEDVIREFKYLPMVEVERKIWSALGRQCIPEEDRLKVFGCDTETVNTYHCHVHADGTYTFKVQSVCTRTHLQRVLGDDNVLMVRFSDNVAYNYESSVCWKIFKEGIWVGLRCYRFFVFKDGGKEEKKNNKNTSTVRCYFVRTESHAVSDLGKAYVLTGKNIHEARCIFMHAHTVSSIEKFMARLSLILSKTITLEIDLAYVDISTIEDIKCQNKDGSIARKDDGEPLIHTDGTGFVSEDIALRCPKGLYKGAQKNHETYLGNVDVDNHDSDLHIREPVRLFFSGRAMKGTLLVNRKLPARTIQIRPSMIKVEQDYNILGIQSANSLEIVTTSNKPRKTNLSRFLIALLCYGGVPKDVFMNILTKSLEEAQSILSNRRAAFLVAMRYGEMDDYIVTQMISCGIPLDEPYVQHRLSVLMNEERKNLRSGKLPIEDSYHLMGAADPSGVLKNDEVCIILDEGQMSGKVLVYRHPGIHFGDIHILTAIYVEDMETYIGNAKYAILFPTKRHRSLADEMAGGDFDGDMFFVSRNPQLLRWFKPSEPWTQKVSQRISAKKKPSELSVDELEHELFQLFLTTRFNPRTAAGIAADSWLSFMDRLLVLGDDSCDEKICVKKKMLRLVDIYYDALDAPKLGSKVTVPSGLEAKIFPHYMGRENVYRSMSILGQIYDAVDSFKPQGTVVSDVWTMSCFEVDVPEACSMKWKLHYEEYRKKMSDALRLDAESKNETAEAVIMDYKQIIYGAKTFGQRTREDTEIFNDALAIYQISYSFAKREQTVSKCSFPWRIAGEALIKLYLLKRGERPLTVSLPVAKEIFY